MAPYFFENFRNFKRILAKVYIAKYVLVRLLRSNLKSTTYTIFLETHNQKSFLLQSSKFDIARSPECHTYKGEIISNRKWEAKEER